MALVAHSNPAGQSLSEPQGFAHWSFRQMPDAQSLPVVHASPVPPPVFGPQVPSPVVKSITQISGAEQSALVSHGVATCAVSVVPKSMSLFNPLFVLVVLFNPMVLLSLLIVEEGATSSVHEIDKLDNRTTKTPNLRITNLI